MRDSPPHRFEFIFAAKFHLKPEQQAGVKTEDNGQTEDNGHYTLYSINYTEYDGDY